jgi:hypothetical protein
VTANRRYTQDRRSSSPSGRITPDHTDDRSTRCRVGGADDHPYIRW